jgi:hypothetical protein
MRCTTASRPTDRQRAEVLGQPGFERAGVACSVRCESIGETTGRLTKPSRRLRRRCHLEGPRPRRESQPLRLNSDPLSRPLAHFFGTSSEFWLTLQNLYDLQLAEQKNRKAINKLPTLKRAKGA